MVRVFLFLFAAHVVLLALALISCLSASGSRHLPRLLWVPVILLLPLLGPAAWFLAGRPVARRPTPGRRVRPAAPDDDSDFLRSLDGENSRRDRELFERWETDLHRDDEPG